MRLSCDTLKIKLPRTEILRSCESYWIVLNHNDRLLNFNPHKIRLFSLFVCYKCVTKKHFYLFLNTYKHSLSLCPNMASNCFFHQKYLSLYYNSDKWKILRGSLNVKPRLLFYFITKSPFCIFHKFLRLGSRTSLFKNAGRRTN